MIRYRFLPVIIPLLAVPAAAITLTGLTTKGTFENAGIRVTYTGDDNQDAAIAVEYREKPTTAWQPGHPLIRIEGDRFAGSLFRLKEGTTYEVRLIPEDKDGAAVNFTQPFEIRPRGKAGMSAPRPTPAATAAAPRLSRPSRRRQRRPRPETGYTFTPGCIKNR